MEDTGYIYIMTNESFKGRNCVKIGYSNDPEKRRKELSGTRLPFDYEIYATYRVKAASKNKDKMLHELIQSLNPDLRLTNNREFFEMTPEQAYSLLELIAQITNTEDCLEKKVKDEIKEEVFSSELFFDRPKLATRIIEFLNNKSDVIVLTTGNVYQRFTTPIIRSKVGLIGDGSWSGLKDLLAYEIKIVNSGKITLTLIIGPGADKDRRYWLDFGLEQGKPFLIKGNKTSTGKWKRVFHYELCDLNKYMTEDAIMNQTINSLEKFFNKEFKEFEEIFR